MTPVFEKEHDNKENHHLLSHAYQNYTVWRNNFSITDDFFDSKLYYKPCVLTNMI